MLYLICKTYLSFESASIIEASKTFNLSTWKILKKVILPISRPAIVAGVTLAVMEAVSDFGVMDYFGVSTFVTGIFRTWLGMGSIEDASKLASILTAILSGKVNITIDVSKVVEEDFYLEKMVDEHIKLIPCI